jgi:hypothetical protein
VAIVVGCLILGFFFGQPSAAQKKDAPATPGRYQAVPVGQTAYVIDTMTGHTWWLNDRRWEDVGSPVKGQ